MDYVDDLECPSCGGYSPNGGWCDICLDAVDLDQYEQDRRERIAEEQEY